jgi:flagellar biosynthesis/type III secretory pathway protein FliH
MKNPKTHDALFKWLITSFTEEFFQHYFPQIPIGQYRFIDKEFISRYEALKESLEDDLFLIMEVEIDGDVHEVVIQIEHVSRKADVSERMYEYLCYAWLLKRKPVWSIVIYTDDALWRKPVSDTFWFGFSSRMAKQVCHIDVIKVKSEKSAELTQKHSLMCKLLALKADDREMDRETLVTEIYHAVERMGDVLDNDKKLLIEQWVNAYNDLPPESLEKIKKEVKMSFVATTISEHIRNQGRIEGINEGMTEGLNKGKLEGKIEGKVEGKVEGQIQILENLYLVGIHNQDQNDRMVQPLRKQLQEIQSDPGQSVDRPIRAAKGRRKSKTSEQVEP